MVGYREEDEEGGVMDREEEEGGAIDREEEEGGVMDREEEKGVLPRLHPRSHQLATPQVEVSPAQYA